MWNYKGTCMTIIHKFKRMEIRACFSAPTSVLGLAQYTTWYNPQRNWLNEYYAFSENCNIAKQNKTKRNKRKRGNTYGEIYHMCRSYTSGKYLCNKSWPCDLLHGICHQTQKQCAYFRTRVHNVYSDTKPVLGSIETIKVTMWRSLWTPFSLALLHHIYTIRHLCF